MNDISFSETESLLPAGSVKSINRQVQAAFQQDKLWLAHRLLLNEIESTEDNVQNWILLAWTAPHLRAAISCFQKALDLDPNSALAIDGLQWAKERLEQERVVAADIMSAVPVTEAAGGISLNDPVIVEAIAPPIQSESMLNVTPAEAVVASPSTHIFTLQYFIPILYLIAIALAELLTSLSAPQVGLALHGVILIGLLLHATMFADGRQQKFLLAISLAPLIRLMSLSLPLPKFPLIYWYAIVGLPLFLATYLVSRVVGFRWNVSPRRARRLPTQVAIGLTGFGLGYLEYLILKPNPLASSFSWEKIWLPALILIVFTGLLEEIIFRGLIQSIAIKSHGRFGLVYGAMLFAVLHIGYRSVLDVVFVFGVAMFFSLVVVKTDSLLGVTLAHGLTNVALFLIFPFIL